ncbi:unnamed protein product [Heligmosomoides polygyrus]|uniref:Reverse transcriptase domain-containing protein n=1 Tax=Heligmosomoides polygyrus TaxID=6339 RepID=A0A183FTW9_HELPZ|nr:unnamed protein product [Heligmosomoides polygyrus]
MENLNNSSSNIIYIRYNSGVHDIVARHNALIQPTIVTELYLLSTAYLNFTSNFWSINDINISNKICSIQDVNLILYSADFVDMFTNIPHDIIIRNVTEIINICFKNANKSFLINKHRSYRKEDIIYMIDYLLQNPYCKLSGVLYKQLKGVPQGGNASPMIADLTLSFFEYKYATNNTLINKVFCPFRYMDDILIQYNKTDYFPFSVVRFPHNSSYTSNSLKRGIILTETLRISRCCSKKDDFIVRLCNLITSLLQLQYSKDLILQSIVKGMLKHKSIAYKYGLVDSYKNIYRFVKQLISQLSM